MVGGDAWAPPSYSHTASEGPAAAAFESPEDGAGLQQWPVVTKNQAHAGKLHNPNTRKWAMTR